MNLTEITQSSTWKKFMAKLYGWGASVVIFGALFKIMHWPGAGIMLTLGLCTESIIFFFSAFEPLHEELDWTLVYPELAGMSDPDEIEEFDESTLSIGKGRTVESFDSMIGLGGGSLDKESAEKLNNEIKKLSETAKTLSDITDASLVTKDYNNNIKAASDSLKTLTGTYDQSSESIKESAINLSNAFLGNANSINQAGSNVVSIYDRLSETLKIEQESIAKGSKSYDEHFVALNKNLAALNAVYELQLKDTSDHMRESKELYGGIGQMMKTLKDSIDETVKYKEEMGKMQQNLSALNSIYGNMLSAMNMMTNK
jgi:gliding motility-associated protein GldL